MFCLTFSIKDERKIELEIELVIQIMVIVAAVQMSPGADDGPVHALFSRLGYPRVGDVPVLNRKVFRGMRVSIMEHPYVVSIRRLRCHYLVGSLLTVNVVITVAHPLYNVSTQELGVVAGENYADRGAAILTVLAVVIHQNFDPFTLLADLALIRLYEDLVVKVHQKAIPIFHKSYRKANTEYKAYVTGWGRCDWTGQELCWPRASAYHPDEKLDPMLRTVTFQYCHPQYNVYCKSYEIYGVPLRAGMLCAGPARQAQPTAPCLAVPGAPLVMLGQLAGVQSWGLGCGYTQDLPLVYTDLDYYVDWLIKNLLVLGNVNKTAIFELYRATRASYVREWLVRTRVDAETRAPPDGAFGPSAVDHAFIDLQGKVTDFRDYIDNGRFRTAKAEMYRSLRAHADKMKAIQDIHETLTTPQSHPFFSKMSEEDSDNVFGETTQTEINGDFFNKINIFTSTTKGSDEDSGEGDRQ